MYNHKEIEKKWQEFWDKNKTFKTENPPLTPPYKGGEQQVKPKWYSLDMFPYPSWAGLHVWHPEWYTANDILSRYKHAKWYNVLHPMWWDAFWLPAENYAIKTWTHPRITTDQNIKTFKTQTKKLGFSYDWDREIDTTDPSYYKWTQWIFLKLFEHGLAYEQDLPINYCPSCKTGLANEEVLNDFTCERCGTKVQKKKIRQWVLAITKYADRLLADVDKLDWPEGIKDMQRNWIGKSEGCEFEMKKDWDNSKFVKVYTTRIDTVFGMTYAVLAPDHPQVLDFITPEQKKACLDYIDNSKKKSDQDRTADNKEKTWVFTWSYVINPYNNEKVPLWIADYVLGNYGTWAVMAVPAHDERDFEFAKKYDLEIKTSILANKAEYIVIENSLLKEHVEGLKNFWEVIVEKVSKNRGKFFKIRVDLKDENKFIDFLSNNLIIKTKEQWWNWYADSLFTTKKVIFNSKIFSINNLKDADLVTNYWISVWVPKWELDFREMLKAYTEDWILVNSWDFDWLSSSEAREKLTEYAEQNWFGTKKVNYKLRDWLYSRQRYWGEPIPLIHLEEKDVLNLPKENNGEAWIKNWDTLMIWNKEFSKIYDWLYGKIVCDYNLPLKLPEVANYEPAWDGNSPLVKVLDFVNVKLANNLSGKRETNTMPQWGWSCWYYLRFMDSKNDKELVNPEVEKYWGQVDSYVWWAEHAVLHLLYARFWHKFLFDIKVVSSDEPFYRLRNQWLILAHAFQRKNWWLLANDLVEEKNGKYYEIVNGEEVNRIISKMSKSLKNVINPDDIVEEYGADSLRLYEMYMAEFKDAAPWDSKWIVWVRRFLEKSERLFTSEAKFSTENDNHTMKLLHKTIKKVEEDIENYKFNTAIAALMILVNNWLPKDNKLQTEWKNVFIRLLHPFAPHLSEELWERIWEKKSVFTSKWPEYDKNLIIDDTITIWVQVLWKLRWEIEIAVDEEEKSVLEKAKNNENVKKWLEWKIIVKEIYVKWKIVNLVVR